MKRDFERVVVKVAAFYRHAPRLPTAAKEWIARNVWWIVLIGAIIGGLGALSLALITLFGGIFLAGAVFLFTAKFGGLALLISVLLVAALLANTIVLIMAIIPLKTQARKGWNLLVVSLTLNLAVAVLTIVLKQDLVPFIWNVLWVGIGGYLLFEIQEYFRADVIKVISNTTPEYRPADTSQDTPS